MQWHKRILSDFSLGFEDRTASSYQECISRASVRKWVGYFPSERQWWQGGKEKKKNLIGLFLFPRVDFLKGESFWSLSYPVLLQPESQASLDQGADPQAGWGVTASWRSIKCPGRLRIGSLGKSRHIELLGPLDWWIPEQVEVWQPFKDQIPRQVKAVWPPGTPGLELGTPKVTSVTSAG